MVYHITSHGQTAKALQYNESLPVKMSNKKRHSTYWDDGENLYTSTKFIPHKDFLISTVTFYGVSLQSVVKVTSP